MDAAAVRRQRFLVALAVVIGFAGFGLAGCGSSLFEAANSPAQEPVAAPKAAVEPPLAKVALNSIVGPPDALGKQLHQEFTAALDKQRVTVTSGKEDGADFHLRPYILAAKEKSGTKVSYVLDVSDGTGKRVNRFTGEEMVPGNPSRDPWAAISPQVAQSITAKATGSLVAWLPNARAAIASAPAAAPAGVGGQKEDAHHTAARAPRPAAKTNVAAAPPPPPPPPPSSQTTGSINREAGPVSALVPAVTGAPGDGGTSLTAAIQRELQGKGVPLANGPSASAYRVEGAVTLGAAREGKQAIQIEWVVKDPQGKRLGTVSQKNDIPEGSLDGAWGRTADQAAGAAVQGIAKLLPSANRAVN
ncbi:MAG: hypothetical protein K2X43_09875 [Hyphomonadaceae bacterium]|nr:hypothetical protein [Hyphomonadaceae bacterium]